MPDPRVLLAILAHPDDESFGPGATLAKYAQAGVAVHYLCGTRGEMGTTDAEHLAGYADTGEMRWAELTAAARELGLAGIHHLGFRDSGMAGSDSNQHLQALSAQPVNAVATRIAHFVRRLKPQVVITHDTIGGYRHPDHIMLNQATLHFWKRMREPAAFPDPDGLPDYYPQKLYYPVFNRRFFKLAARIMPLLGRDPRKFGRNQDVDLMSLIDVDFPINTVIDTKGAPAEARQRAAACHKSQLPSGPPRQGLLGLLTRLLFFRSNRDTYMRVHPPVAESGRVNETDLFAGVL